MSHRMITGMEKVNKIDQVWHRIYKVEVCTKCTSITSHVKCKQEVIPRPKFGPTS